MGLLGTDRIYSSCSYCKVMHDEKVTLWKIKYLPDFKTISTEVELAIVYCKYLKIKFFKIS